MSGIKVKVISRFFITIYNKLCITAKLNWLDCSNNRVLTFFTLFIKMNTKNADYIYIYLTE